MMREWTCRQLENGEIHAITEMHIQWSEKVSLSLPRRSGKASNDF